MTRASADPYEASSFGGFAQYFANKKAKLQIEDERLRRGTEHNAQIFKSLVVCVNGYTRPSLQEIHRLVVQHGGTFKQYSEGKTTVTHIVASNLTPSKKVEFARYKVVRPEWITASVEAKQLLPWSDFKVIEEVPGQRLLSLRGDSILTKRPATVNPYQRPRSTPERYVADSAAERAQSSTGPQNATYEIQPVFKGQNDIDAPSPKKVKTDTKLNTEGFLSDPRVRKPTVLNPDFLSTYYKSSRLHHLSTCKLLKIAPPSN